MYLVSDDLNWTGPAELVLAGPNGNAGCKSACFANLDGNQGNQILESQSG